MVSFLRALAFFILLTGAMTWPQARHIATHASDHQDVYFNMWRFGWVAHALSSPGRVFDGNMFYPERRVLTFSDALIVEALAAAPMLWAGLPPVLVHNLVLLGGMVLSGAGMFMLARHHTGSTAAALAAGIIFAFAPYRFEHYMHMELQWPVWVPWAFWALDRTVLTGKWRYGLLTGAFIALQFMSSIYYGIFLAALLGTTAMLRLVASDTGRTRAAVSLAVGAVLGAALCLPYAQPFLETREEMGGRSEGEVGTYSARARDYLVPTTENYLYGESAPRRGRSERRLFPGALAALLGLTALMVSRPSVVVLVYLLGLIAAFEMSLGVRGFSYPVLHEYVPGFESLRAPARLGIFVLFFLAVLAAHGYAAIERAMRPRLRAVLAIAVCAILAIEYWVAPLRLVPYPNSAPALYAWLARQPLGVVAEFPMPAVTALPGHDARYAYMSTFHWMPTVNGYSGYYPQSYLDRLTRLEDFPDDTATLALRRAGVRYVIIHRNAYPGDDADPIVAALTRDLAYVPAGRHQDGWGEAVVFRLR